MSDVWGESLPILHDRSVATGGLDPDVREDRVGQVAALQVGHGIVQ